MPEHMSPRSLTPASVRMIFSLFFNNGTRALLQFLSADGSGGVHGYNYLRKLFFLLRRILACRLRPLLRVGRLPPPHLCRPHHLHTPCNSSPIPLSIDYRHRAHDFNPHRFTLGGVYYVECKMIFTRIALFRTQHLALQ